MFWAKSVGFFQRFGCALVETGQICLKNKEFAMDHRPIDENCTCSTCKTYTRSYLHHIVKKEAVASSILSVHNIAYQLNLMLEMRKSILEDTFPKFVKEFMKTMYENREVPIWIVDALKAVNVDLSVNQE